MAKKWIAGAISKPGSLRATAKREGLIKGNQKLSDTILSKMSGPKASTKTKKRVALARTLMNMHR